MRILVFGAGGIVGSHLVEVLLAEGVQVRATTRDPAKYPAPAPGLEWVPYNGTGNDESINPLFREVDRVFLLSPGEIANAQPFLSPLISAAGRHRVKKAVMMTGMGPDDGPQLPFRHAEAELRESGIPFHVLRPNWFMQNFHTYWVEEIRAAGKLRLPAGDAEVSFIDSRDISEAAAKLLLDDKLASQTDTVTGGEAFSHAEAVARIAAAAGRPVVYENISPEEFHSAMAAHGASEEDTEMMNALFGHIREGHLSEVTGAVPRILGRPARTFDAYAREFADAWKE